MFALFLLLKGHCFQHNGRETLTNINKGLDPLRDMHFKLQFH